MSGQTWTVDETMMAFVLYYMLPPRDIVESNPEIRALAHALDRTPGAVKLKIWNIAAHDANRIASGRVGMRNGSKLDSEIWELFSERGDDLIDEGIELLNVALASRTDRPKYQYAVEAIAPWGKDVVVTRTERVNQQYFRNTLLKNYEEKCCLTGLSIPKLLVASHIKPWAVADPKKERLAASNGLLLNALHDRAFDQGLITINQDHELVVSSKLKKDDATAEWLFRFAGQKIREPLAMPPAREFIEYHNDAVFLP